MALTTEPLLPCMEARPWADGRTVTYRFKPVGRPWVNLGTDYRTAINKVLDITGHSPYQGSVRWLWDQWQSSARCQRLAEGTRADYRTAWKQIEPHLGLKPAGSIDAPTVARYVHQTRAGSPRRADIEKALLSNLFKHGIRLGVCLTNPTIGVEPHGSDADVRPPPTDVLQRFLVWLNAQSVQRRVIGHMAEFIAVAGNRRIEFLDLTRPQVDLEAGVIRLTRAKQRGKRKGEVIERVAVTPRLRELIERIYATLDPDSTYLFPNKFGNAYSTEGFESLWQRCVLDAIKAGVFTRKERFNFHALRHYYVTEHDKQYGSLPNLHADSRVTQNIYNANFEVNRKAL